MFQLNFEMMLMSDDIDDAENWWWGWWWTQTTLKTGLGDGWWWGGGVRWWQSLTSGALIEDTNNEHYLWLIIRWTVSMSDWTMSPQCFKISDLFGKISKQMSENSQIWKYLPFVQNLMYRDDKQIVVLPTEANVEHINVFVTPNSFLCSCLMLHFRKNEFISLYLYLYYLFEHL